MKKLLYKIKILLLMVVIVISTDVIFPEKEKDKNIKITMFGDSITHGGKWKILLHRADVFEYGVEGDMVVDFRNRLEKIIKLKPKICFIMGGINDIYSWRRFGAIYSDYIFILEKLRENKIIPVIQSTLYAAKSYSHSEDRNKIVHKLNVQLKEYAEKEGIDFINLNKKMSDDNYLKKELTWDGLHLNDKAYLIWKKEIKKILEEHKI